MGSATRHKWTHATYPNPESRRVLNLTTPEGWKAELTIGYQELEQPEVELATSRSQIRRPNHYTTEPHVTNSELYSHIRMWNSLTCNYVNSTCTSLSETVLGLWSIIFSRPTKRLCASVWSCSIVVIDMNAHSSNSVVKLFVLQLVAVARQSQAVL